MKPASILCLFTTASFAIADAVYAEASQPAAERPLEPANELVQEYEFEETDLQARQAKDYYADATTAVTQAPVVTTIWMQTSIGTTVTYVPVTYTQTFEKFPGQYPLPGVGTIGYGTLSKKSKRDAEPTGAGTSFVLEMHTEVVTVWLEPVKRVVEVRTVMRMGNDTLLVNGTAIPPANLTATAPQNETISTTKFIFPSQTNPEFARPSINTEAP